MSEQLQAYCVKCRTKRDLTAPQPVYTKAGTPATKGQCPVCGTGLFLMGETPAHAGIPRPEVTERAAPKRKVAAAKKSSRGKSSGRAKSARKTGSSAAGGKKRSGRVGKLVIVESPAKARSVGGFLGRGYTVLASKGHVRDLLVTQLSVDVENDFEPRYRVPNDKRDTVKELKDAADAAEEIYLATDPDREGEAIAWHLIAAADMEPQAIKRVVFHEITDPAIKHAFDHPRSINTDLVDAQQARRILDRLVGYNITELLWDRVRNRLSAGRVQSVALRLVVDREREIEAFVPEEYWTLEAELEKQGLNGSENIAFVARLIKIRGESFSFGSEEDVRPHLEVLEKSVYRVASVKRGTRQRKPSAPFTTSTLQQEASRRLGYNAQRTMRIAQQLYEGIELGREGAAGLITYMRTDSVSVSSQAQQEARQYVSARYGQDYLPDRPPQYKTRTRGAQEAHEAIRPTQVMRDPASVREYLKPDQFKLYKLIWERFVASQMANAIYDTLTIDIDAGPSLSDLPYTFRTSGRTIRFQGFLAVYEETRDEDAASDEDEGRSLPNLSEADMLNLLRLLPEQHFTQPPPRYTEATLVRTLEEYGIGRPSTYAPTVAVIQDRDYVTKQDKRLVPTETGKTVNDLLVQFFPDELDYHFTARMEDHLDEVAEGKIDWRPMLRDFYMPFEQRLDNARRHMPTMHQEEAIGRICPTCNQGDLVVRYGRWGKFIGCSRYPDCRHTEQFVELTGVNCPRCGTEEGGELVVRRTRKGRTFFGCSRYPECDYSTWKLPGKGKRTAEAEDEEEEEDVLQKPTG